AAIVMAASGKRRSMAASRGNIITKSPMPSANGSTRMRVAARAPMPSPRPPTARGARPAAALGRLATVHRHHLIVAGNIMVAYRTGGITDDCSRDTVVENLAGAPAQEEVHPCPSPSLLVVPTHP